MTRQHLSSTGSLGRLSPLPRYYWLLRLPTAIPLRFGLPSARRYLARHLRSRAGARILLGPEACSPGAPAGRLGDGRISQVPGESSCAFALPSDPGRASVPRLLRYFGTAPAPMTTKASALMIISGLDFTAFALAVYASQPGSPRLHARLASGWWLASTGRDLDPQDSSVGFRHRLHDFPLTQALPGATSVHLLIARRTFSVQYAITRTCIRPRPCRGSALERASATLR